MCRHIHGASSEFTRLPVSAEFVSSTSLNLFEQLGKAEAQSGRNMSECMLFEALNVQTSPTDFLRSLLTTWWKRTHTLPHVTWPFAEGQDDISLLAQRCFSIALISCFVLYCCCTFCCHLPSSLSVLCVVCDSSNAQQLFGSFVQFVIGLQYTQLKLEHCRVNQMLRL